MKETADTIRFSVSLPGNLLDELDRRVTSRGYASRSELVRDMIRERLVEDAWQAGDEVAGVLVIIFDHHQRELTQKLIDVQHRQEVHVLCSTHVHLDHDNCLETIILQGHPPEIEHIVAEIGGLKGVKFAKLTRTSRL
ncbi:nickel-responsive transcriptional regulator NikR [Thiorhodococcus mannitoliphagus]|uniref:Putative nickel-responsive regulator n=1 Tax=Thiorhodococcus mannitoliphagus TaxID=329406 RepID=A0A6P1DM37_9GAMM|nr:nickel-responsive transcriptional regulator NikR [Thiorhodococcus mannitoliphagus]NEX18979.1 nickel-responsive transcriptional regulator NikR [Thiorhodococcus mannitoliphagus]